MLVPGIKLVLELPQISALEPIILNTLLNILCYLAEMIDSWKFANSSTFQAYDSDLSSLPQKLTHGAFTHPCGCS